MTGTPSQPRFRKPSHGTNPVTTPLPEAVTWQETRHNPAFGSGLVAETPYSAASKTFETSERLLHTKKKAATSDATPQTVTQLR